MADSEDEVSLLVWLFCILLTIHFYQCFTPHCIPHNVCEEDQLLYQDVCWDKTNFSVPCQVKNKNYNPYFNVKNAIIRATINCKLMFMDKFHAMI